MERPKLQIALDTFDLASALAPLEKAHEHLDVIEVGTVLCLSEGMEAVRVIRQRYPDKTLLADIRIVEAGAILSKMAFNAGANWVSVFGGTSLTAIEAVWNEARKRGGDVQVEIFEDWDKHKAKAWRDMGIEQIITHRSRDAEAKGTLSWSQKDFDRIHELSEMGFKVTITGGVTPEDIPLFTGVPVYIFIAGRAIREAADPAAAAKAFQDAIHELEN